MESLTLPQLLALAAALGWASGVRLYLVVLLTGLAGYLGWVQLPGGLHLLAHPVVLVASGFVVFVEFFADCRKRGGAMAPSPSGGGSGWGPAAAPQVTAAGPHPNLPPKVEGAKPFCASFQRAKE
jgi:hypothetical protein